MKKKNAKWKKTVSIISIIFFIISFLFLMFATFALKSDASFFGYRFYYVLTESMEPDITKGTLIISEEVPAKELKVGDVISFVSDDPDIRGQINTHNIDSITYDTQGDPIFTTKGTNNPTVDKYPVYTHSVKGRMVYQSETLGKVFTFLSNRWVSFFMTIVPLAVIVLIYFVDLVKVINFFPDDKKEGKIKAESCEASDADKNENS